MLCLELVRRESEYDLHNHDNARNISFMPLNRQITYYFISVTIIWVIACFVNHIRPEFGT